MNCVTNLHTPRTVPPGSVAHSVAVEALAVFATRPGTEYELHRKVSTDDGSALLPSYMVRFGLGERTDFGVRAVNLLLPGFDLKINLFQSRRFDIAVDPTMQGFLPIPDWAHLHLPLLLGFNVAESLSIVLTPGLLHTPSLFTSVNLFPDRHTPARMESSGLMARLGMGVNVSLFRSFALHPEVTLLRSLQPSRELPYTNMTWVMLGLGFNFGTLPSFEDVAGGETDACDDGGTAAPASTP